MGILGKLKGAATFALDLTAAVAKNPLAILSPTKEAAKIKQLRSDIAAGDREKAISYIKTTAVQTALNVGGVAAGAGLLGAGTKAAATSIAAKAVKVGVVAAPFVVGSSTIREAVASTSPVEIGVKTAEKIEKAVKAGDEKAVGITNVLGMVGSGAIGAGLVGAAGLAVDYFKDKKEDTPFQPIGSTPAASATPITPATETVNLGKEAKGNGTKRKRRKSKPAQMPSINIKIDNREDNDTYDRKVYKGRRS